MTTFSNDVIVVGASLGGVASALAASADPKVRVVLLESSTWVAITAVLPAPSVKLAVVSSHRVTPWLVA